MKEKSLVLDSSSALIWLFKVAAWCFVFLEPIREITGAVFFLMSSYLFFGVYAAIRRNERITSYGIRRTISKIFLYGGAIISSFVVEKYFLTGIPIARAVAATCAFTEIFSILENIQFISGIDFFQAIKEKLNGPSIKWPENHKKKKK